MVLRLTVRPKGVEAPPIVDDPAGGDPTGGLGTNFAFGGGAAPWDYDQWLRQMYQGQQGPGVPQPIGAPPQPEQQQPTTIDAPRQAAPPLPGPRAEYAPQPPGRPAPPSNDPQQAFGEALGNLARQPPQQQGAVYNALTNAVGWLADKIGPAIPPEVRPKLQLGLEAANALNPATALRDYTAAAKEGHYGEAGLNALGLVPGEAIGAGLAKIIAGAKAVPAAAAALGVGLKRGGKAAPAAGDTAAVEAKAASAPPSTGDIAAQSTVTEPRMMRPDELQQGLWQHSEQPWSRQPILPGDNRVSTRFPTGVDAENPLTHHLGIGSSELATSPGLSHNVSLLSEYPGFAHLKGMSDPDAVRAYLDQAKGNMQYLYDKSPPVMKARSPLWYEGAHEISDAFARRWGVPRPSASGALASLSPQMDWFKNASLGERTGDILTGAAAGKILTPGMAEFGRTTDFLKNPEGQELLRSILGKKLDQLDDPLQKALWVRLYDEAHNPRAYRSVTPEGNFGDFIRNQDGSQAKVGWGALGEIEKAIRALESGGDPRIISPALGTKHKVRSFYNNIEVPNDPRFADVTADTHQVAAAQLRPLSGNTPAVAHNLASGIPRAKQPEGYRAARSSAVTGTQGTYGWTADATRNMARENDMLPRAAQSATWEPVRQLFSPKFKADKANTEAVDNIWRAYDRGEISLERARDAIFDFAGGIAEPGWAGRGARVSAPSKGSTYR